MGPIATFALRILARRLEQISTLPTVILGGASSPLGLDQRLLKSEFVRDYGLRVVELLNVKPDEEILDLGCGDGLLSALLMESGARVTGIDIDPDAVARARERGVDAYVLDGQHLNFPARFNG
eukprot:gene26574-29142_t